MKYIRLINQNKGEYISFRIGGRIGINFWVRLRSAVDGVTPYYMFGIFVWGTFLGVDPYNNSHCASNGISLFYINLSKSKEE